jgi:hypothetical protein
MEMWMTRQWDAVADLSRSFKAGPFMDHKISKTKAETKEDNQLKGQSPHMEYLEILELVHNSQLCLLLSD